MSTTNNPPSVPNKTFKEFLESTPPEVEEDVIGLFTSEVVQVGRKWNVAWPDLFLHCPSEQCNGLRFFRKTDSSVYPQKDAWVRGFASYLCRNCQKTSKAFALIVFCNGSNNGSAYKFGELPVYGPPIPARVITLIGPDRDHFLLGRRAENHGLGIGAFAYYRRVLENQKGRIINEIARVAKKLGAPKEVLQDFEKAAAETQFKTAIDDIKAGLPSVLMIEGHNPLTLLHTALSEGLHTEDDKTCLELAQSIRTVLTELAERMSSVLKDQQELHSAVSKLLNRKGSKASPGASPTEKGK
jgi:hypothetical protein